MVAQTGVPVFGELAVLQITVEELSIQHNPLIWSLIEKFLLFDLGFPLGQGEFSLVFGRADGFPLVLALVVWRIYQV